MQPSIRLSVCRYRHSMYASAVSWLMLLWNSWMLCTITKYFLCWRFGPWHGMAAWPPTAWPAALVVSTTQQCARTTLVSFLFLIIHSGLSPDGPRLWKPWWQLRRFSSQWNHSQDSKKTSTCQNLHGVAWRKMSNKKRCSRLLKGDKIAHTFVGEFSHLQTRRRYSVEVFSFSSSSWSPAGVLCSFYLPCVGSW